MDLRILGQASRDLQSHGDLCASTDDPIETKKLTGVLIVGHGSRDPRGNAEFEELVAAYRSMRPDVNIGHGYIEIASPSLSESLGTMAREHERVLVVPLFLFGAGHLKNDIPLALAQARHKYPHVQFSAARELGVDASLIELAFRRASALVADEPERKKSTAVIVVGRGASDPDANGDFCKFVRLFGEGRNFTWVLPSFIGITRPLFEETAELVARSRPERILVVPYFLFGGRLLSKLQEQVAAFAARYPWIEIGLSECLGNDAQVLRVLNERVQQAANGVQALPCDTCHYRVPIAGITKNVGGLRAMLWSIRHAFTHTQAVPHVHAHKPLAKHVLVCANIDCAGRGSIALASVIKRLVRAAGRERDIRVTRTGCMGRCGEGPTVAVYPDGIWYRGVQEGDAEELVREHLLNDRLVGRLVDNIMQ
jgi:sirohydrochlorin ferrochelatase/(2Fe-2S) ferredoxin